MWDNILSMPVTAATMYDAWVTEKPMEAKIVTATVLNAAADILAQIITKMKASRRSWTSWQLLSPLRLVLWGLICTPIIDIWLAFLDGTFGVENDMKTLGKKLFVDQLLFGPLLLSVFLIFVGAFDALTTKFKFMNTFHDLPRQVITGSLTGMVYWLPISICMFTVVPARFRLLLLSLAGLLYNIWLSLWVSTKNDKKASASSVKSSKAGKSKKAD